jgi:ribosomal-protein-alanine N-acetyltransferase
MASLNAYRYITTPQLILRPIELTDAPAIFSYTSDPRVAHFTHWDAHTNLDDTIRYITHIQQNTNTHVWGITLPESNTLIGECSITQHEDGRAELYYALAYAHWGNGHTTQALTALLSIAQEIPTLDRLEAWIIRENLASCRVAQKAGLHLEQIIDQAWIIDTTAHDIALYIK